MVTPLVRKLIIWLGFVLLFVSWLLTANQACIAQRELSKLRNQHTTVLSELEVTKNKNVSLEDIYSRSEEENEKLNTIISELKTKPPKIKYVVTTETKIVEEKVEIYPELPNEYIYRGVADLAVAKFAVEGSEYKFESFDVTLNGVLVIGENKSGLTLSGTSSYEPDRSVEIPVNLTVERLIQPEEKLFNPAVHLGGMVTSSPDIRLTLIGSALRYKHFSFIGIGTSFNKETAGITFIPAMYNIGKPLPLIDDLSIGVGFGYNSDLLPEGTVTLTTQL